MRVFTTLSLGLAAFAHASSALAHSFTYNTTSFLLNGEPFQIIGGQMDPQRVPWQYWKQRLAMACAMGLNTIFGYVYWNNIEDQPGVYHTNGNNDIYAYAQEAHEAGLQVVLRVGPYICGEHEWGGFPAWLNNIDNMTVRSKNPQFLDRTQSWLNWLADWLRPMMISNGGPIIMVQIENEYGFYSDDHSYTDALAAQFKASFAGSGVVVYTNDGSSQSSLQAGSIPGVLAEIDGTTPLPSFQSRSSYLNVSSQGPNLDGEYYITWIDKWDPYAAHESDVNNTQAIENAQSILKSTVTSGDSFSIYMFNGGTNFGFQSGSDFGNGTEPVTTSYDYGAPLDESGRPNDIYYALRQTLGPFSRHLPDAPHIEPMISIPQIDVEPSFYLFDGLPTPQHMNSPTNMEALGQWYGFTLYRTNVNESYSGLLQPGVAAKDRIIVYVNGVRQGVFDSRYPNNAQQNLSVTLNSGDVLDVLNENMGRVNFGSDIPYQTKGIFGDVTVGGNTLTGWDVYTLPLDRGMAEPSRASTPTNISSSSSPIFYTGTFDLHTISDTWLELPGWTKGVIWVNGNNLGRYWTIGPQQSYYLPGVWMQERDNVIQILNLEPTGQEGTVSGVTWRSWFNNPDPDAPPGE
ncbi:hypothetical protein N7520_000050 [Penicillium odoratum]|uniref:uncharacterized protein n=1 Tax=Penicillium odoratum TaxID=1167516 RepID=UPI0025473D79|nr:uncharacterized protein N7520_000050 [Penicillium odoratum]KAJ5776804.1 hypothetical protein N7520_000050 [Penicillium odoratum]